MSHAGYLRDNYDGPEDDVVQLIRALNEAAIQAMKLPMEPGLLHVNAAMQRATREPSGLHGDRPLLTLVNRLTLAPRTMRSHHLQPLRDAGFGEREIHDAVHVVCCFSYMNRLADGLGVESLKSGTEWALKLFDKEGVQEHLRWAAGKLV